MIFFWADTHFNHQGIIGYCGRPFKTVEEMNASLIERWNSVVEANDTIYLLGDFGFHPRKDGDGEDLLTLFNSLNGFKHLVIGNHDQKNPKVLKLPWSSQQMLGVVKFNHTKVVVCHYALETWAGAHQGVLHCHGHSHGTLKRKIPHRWDVGVDVEPVPVSWDDLLERATKQVFDPVDHHGDL